MISRRSAPIVGDHLENIASNHETTPSAWVFAPHAPAPNPSPPAARRVDQGSAASPPSRNDGQQETSPVRDAWSPEPGPCRPRTTTSPGRPAWIEIHRSRRRTGSRPASREPPPRARPSPCGNRPASSRSGPSRPRRERSCRSLQRANDPRQRRAVGGQRNARDHRADEDFQAPLRPAQPSPAGRLQHHRRKAERVRPSSIRRTAS